MIDAFIVAFVAIGSATGGFMVSSRIAAGRLAEAERDRLFFERAAVRAIHSRLMDAIHAAPVSMDDGARLLAEIEDAYICAERPGPRSGEDWTFTLPPWQPS